MFWIASLVAVLLVVPAGLGLMAAHNIFDDIKSGYRFPETQKRDCALFAVMGVVYLGAAIAVAAFAAGLY